MLHPLTIVVAMIGGLLFAVGAAFHGSWTNIFVGFFATAVVVYAELRRPNAHFAIAAIGVLMMGIASVSLGPTNALDLRNGLCGVLGTVGALVMVYAFLAYRYPGNKRGHLTGIAIACCLLSALFVASIR